MKIQLNFFRFNNCGFLLPTLILCSSNTWNPSVFYFILKDRLVSKAILCHTKRRQHFLFSSAMLQMIKYKKSMKFNNKIKITQDRRTEKSHFKVQNIPFIDVIILLLVSQILQFLSSRKESAMKYDFHQQSGLSYLIKE